MDERIFAMLDDANYWTAMSPGRLLNMYHWLRGVLNFSVPGAVAEMGTFRGETAAFLQATLLSLGATKPVHVFDSFAGLPPLGPNDGIDTGFFEGMFDATILDVRNTFVTWDLPLPTIHAGWFADTLSRLPDALAFVHLDGDLYDSTMKALTAVYPRLSPGAIVAIDDYDFPGTPGVRAACDEFFVSRPERVERIWCMPHQIQKTVQGFFVKQ